MSRMDRACEAIGRFLVITVVLFIMVLAFFVSWKITVIAVALVLMYCAFRGQVVEPKMKELFINIFSGRIREVGQGLAVPMPWERLATINESAMHSIQKPVLEVKIDVEAKNGEFVRLPITVVYRIANMERHLDFWPEDFRKSIENHAESFATDIAHQCNDYERILKEIEDNAFEKAILTGFRGPMLDSPMTVEQYHGIEVETVIISDPEQPEEVKKAAQEKLVAKKRAEALVEEVRGLNEAAKVLQGRTPKGEQPKIEKDRALLAVQRQQGKVIATTDEFGFAPDTLKTIEKVPGAGIPVWALAILKQIGGGRGGKRGGKDQRGGK